MTAIHNKAMLAALNISVWTARKSDKKATLEVISSNGAASGSGNFSKALVAKEAIKAISGIAGEARGVHYAMSLPWTQAGERILPAELYLTYAEKMRDLRAKFEAAVADFLRDYPAYVQDAQRSLGGLYRAEDYPSPAKMARKFGFSVDISPLPVADDFRVSLGAAEEAEIKAAIEARSAAAIKAATADIWDRMREVTSRMVERLGEYGVGPDGKATGVFRDSLVENVRDLVTLLPRLNFAGDAALAAVADEMARKLCTYSADELRGDEFARKIVREDAAAILATMAGYCGDDLEMIAAE